MADFEAIVEGIVGRSGLSRDEVLARIWQKYWKDDKTLNLVSLEGAARMVAEELRRREREGKA